jgi:hypothetical protein
VTNHVKPATSHHFVPKFLSRRFVDVNGRLHFIDKRIADRGLLAGKPSEVFKQAHLNSIKRSDGTKNTSPETMFFCPLDDLASHLVERIVSAARNGKTPKFSPSEKETWDFFFHHQWKRTPDFYQKIGLQEMFDDYLKGFIAEYERDVRPLTADERKSMECNVAKARIKHNASVSARMRPGPNVLIVLGGKGLGIARIRDPKKSFVIGSSSVVKLTLPNRTHLSDPIVEAWMPIAYDVVVTPWEYTRTEQLVNIASHHVRGINEAIFLDSLVIAGRSPELIASLSRAKCPCSLRQSAGRS